MKVFLLTLSLIITEIAIAQKNTLSSGVFIWDDFPTQTTEIGERKQLMDGQTLDLSNLKIHASTLSPGKTNHPLVAYDDREEVIIVKEGKLQVQINDSNKILTPGSVALILPGDKQSFHNASDQPATYYVLRLVSRKGLNKLQKPGSRRSVMKDWNELAVKPTGKGERRDILDMTTSMLGNLEIHATALNPGFDSHAPHTHRAEELIIMTKGNITMQIGDNFHKASAGDVIFLASNDAHAAKNTGYEQCGYFAIQWLNQSVQNMEVTKKDSGNIIAEGASLKLISNQFKFTEGPAIDKKGNVFFTDQPSDKIWKYDTEGKLSVFMDKTGRSNGLYFDKKGNLLACADEKNEIWSISPKKKITVLFTDYQGKKLNGPNDLWADEKGGIYFTDPYYQRSYWTRKEPEIPEQRVYYLPKGHKEAIIVDESLKKPNGIIGTPDGKYLYVADIGDNKTYRFTINANGTLSDRQLFVEQGSDGLTLDNQGNVYLTGKGVTVYNKEGQKIEHIPVPSGWTANVCFYGKERNMLFITASDSVYTLEMKVRGAE